MATPLDLGLLKVFLPVFSFLFIFAITYALFQKTSILKSKALSLTAAFSIAALFLFTPDALKIVEIAAPWFILFIVFLVMIIVTLMFFGINEEEISGVFKNPTVYYPVLLIIIGIFFFAITQLFGPQVQAIFGGGDADVEGNIIVDIGQVVFHPRVIGAVIVILIASFAIRLIASKPKD